MATPNLFADAQVVTAKVKQLTNEKLRNTLRGVSLPTSGVKAVLQGRLIDRKFLSLVNTRSKEQQSCTSLGSAPETMSICPSSVRNV